MSVKRRNRRLLGHAATRRGPAFALAALFAVLLQAFVVQTHIHGPIASIGASIEHAVVDGAAHAETLAVDEHQAFACAVCQTLASGGSATLPAATTLAAGRQTTDVATFALPRAPPAASHAWQSRAPPRALQA